MSKLFLAMSFVVAGILMLIMEATMGGGEGEYAAYHCSGMFFGAGGTMAVWTICDYLALAKKQVPERQ
jgi:hypothetical protein